MKSRFLPRIVLAGAILLFAPTLVLAQGNPVPLSAVAVSESPPQLRLEWDYINYWTSTVERRIYRRAKDSTAWGTPIATLTSAANTLSYTDTTLVSGTHYEYRVETRINGNTTKIEDTGYVSGGINLPVVDSRGKLLLLVDQSHAGALAPELSQLEEDLAADGWTVIRHDLPRSTVDPATAYTAAVGAARTAELVAVKDAIRAAYNADPTNAKAAYIVGHLPVPYSGNLNPDGHLDHRGAWPADTYYGELTSGWTDFTVNTTTATDPRNRNVPNDGKLDQSTLLSDLELQVGRVDFRNMTVFPTAGVSETELLRRYLRKAHDYKRKQGAYTQIERRALVINAFSSGTGSPSMVTSIGAVLGRSAGLTDTPTGQKSPWFTWMEANPTKTYLIGSAQTAGGATGNGAGDSYDFGLRPSRAVFTVLFGSYLGDWGYDNNFMRAALAGNATGDSLGLTCFWGGRPNLYLQAMGLGETIGYATLVSQNAANSLYPSQYGVRQVHTGLMGDPALRLYTVAPPSGLQANSNLGSVHLSWQPSAESNLLGYLVYRGPSPTGPFARLTPSFLSTTSYTDATGTPGTSYSYLVKTVKLETTPAGTFQNASLGAVASLTVNAGAASVPAAPGNLTVTAPASTQIRLSWTDNASDETAYRIERKTSPSGAFSALITLPPDATGYTDPGPISAGQTFYYRVFAVGTDGDSLPSNTASVSAYAGSVKFASDTLHLDRTPGFVDVPVRRIGGHAGTVSVRYATELSDRDSAAPGVHYVATSGTLTFHDGETLKTFRVHLLGSSPQPVLTLTTRLSNPVGTHLINHPLGSWFGPVATVILRDPAAQLIEPWTSSEVGTGIEPGETGYVSGTISSVYWGSTWNSNGSESGRFIYRTLTGDSVLTARVTAPNNQTAALMVRASNSTGSRMVAVRFTNNSSEGAKFWARDSEGWPITQITLPSASNGIQAPYWARITRSGNSFTGEVSPDGVTWTALGSYTVTGMPATARWGFFQGVDQYAAPRWATFSQISVSNAALPPTYAQWLASYGLPSDGTGEGATTASPVSDGIPNIIKYALGISPLVSGYQGRYSVVPATVGESSYLTLSFTRSEPPPDGFTYIPEGSADLATWSGNGWVLLSSTVSAGLRTTVVRDAVPLDTGNRFVRLRISHP